MNNANGIMWQEKVRIIIHARKIDSTLRYRNLQFSLRKKKDEIKAKRQYPKEFI